MPIFSHGINGAWVLRFDDVLADALELGPLRNNSVNLPNDILDRIQVLWPEKVPAEVIRTSLIGGITVKYPPKKVFVLESGVYVELSYAEFRQREDIY